MVFHKHRSLAFLFSAAAAALLLAGVASAATTDNLEDLVVNQGSLSLGDKVFSNFTFKESGLTSFDPSNIQVTLSVTNGTYFLTWDGNMSLVSNAGPVTADLLLGYSVTATGGLIDTIDASFTGSAQPFSSAFLGVDETARDASGHVVGSTHLDNANRSDSFPIAPPQSILNVTKDISFGISNSGFVSISEISQSFHQTAVPEPATTMLFGSGLLAGVLYLRRRRS